MRARQGKAQTLRSRNNKVSILGGRNLEGNWGVVGAKECGEELGWWGMWTKGEGACQSGCPLHPYVQGDVECWP